MFDADREAHHIGADASSGQFMLAQLAVCRAGGMLYGAPYVTIHRADCHALLAEAAQEAGAQIHNGQTTRSEERRVGKECRSRWSPYH